MDKNKALCANVASELAKFASNKYFIYGGKLFPYNAQEFETLEGCNASSVNLFGVASTLYTMPDGVVLTERDAKMAWTADFFDYAKVIGVEYITNGGNYAACRIKLTCDCGELVIDTQVMQVRLYDGGNYETCDIACEICADVDILYEMKYNSHAIKEAENNDNVQTAGDKQEKNEMDNNAIIKGYITNLGKYNEGVLAYKLISFPINKYKLNEALATIGCKYTDENGVVHNEFYEEFFFSDWECEIPFDFGEFSSISEINDIAERVEALEAYEQDVLKVILEEHTSNVDEALRIVEDNDYRTWDSCDNMADVAEAMVAEYDYLNDVPENLRYYIDYEKWGRDLKLEGTFLEGDGFFVEILD